MSSTALEGWTFDNSRSSWDIVWTCLTTIFACTWTVLHMPVFRRNSSEGLVLACKLVLWTIALFAPEFWRVWSLRARCNETQAASDCRTGEPDSWLGEDRELHPVPARWTLAQCWCVQMDGLTLETEDEWIFYVGVNQATALIEAGVIRCSDSTEREIKDRAKADTLAKTFTVCQSTWATANIVACAGCGLPITPFEFATLSYVAYAIMAYACWWEKPQDMAVPITIPLRHTRDAMPAEIRRLTDARPNRWMHRHVIPPNERVSAGFALIGSRFQRAAVDEPVSGTRRREFRGLSLQEEWWLNTFAGLAAFLFCGIHVAAWNFAFPIDAEATAWRVFSLVALVMPGVVYLLGQAPLVHSG
ncbi:hypothetical protein BDW72DRAFT_189099 [Aspergillus terricola var. indicus]